MDFATVKRAVEQYKLGADADGLAMRYKIPAKFIQEYASGKRPMPVNAADTFKPGQNIVYDYLITLYGHRNIDHDDITVAASALTLPVMHTPEQATAASGLTRDIAQSSRARLRKVGFFKTVVGPGKRPYLVVADETRKILGWPTL